VVANGKRIRIACFNKFGYSSNTTDQYIVNESVLNLVSNCVSKLFQSNFHNPLNEILFVFLLFWKDFVRSNYIDSLDLESNHWVIAVNWTNVFLYHRGFPYLNPLQIIRENHLVSENTRTYFALQLKIWIFLEEATKLSFVCNMLTCFPNIIRWIFQIYQQGIQV